MSHDTLPPTETPDRDASKTARFLANLKRNAAATPAVAPTPAAPVATRRDPDDEPAKKPAPAARRRPSDDDEVSMNIRLDPGTGKRVVYVRVDKTLADRLQLIAFQNKIAGNNGPKTVNDIGIEALLEWLDAREGRQVA